MERCKRCGGQMLKERFFARMGEHWDGLRCLFCGEITDPIIEENRSFIPIPDQRGRWKKMRKVEEEVTK